MTTTTHALLLAITLASTGCFAGSAQPWFADSARIDEPGAVGTWSQSDADAETTLVVGALPGRAYRVELVEKGNRGTPTRFVVSVARLGKSTWADVQVDPLDERYKGVAGFVVRPHLAVRYAIEGDTLTLRMVGKKWFDEQMARKRVKVPFVAASSDHEMTLFTGTTAQMSEALRSLDREPGAFEDAVVFRRVRP